MINYNQMLFKLIKKTPQAQHFAMSKIVGSNNVTVCVECSDLRLLCPACSPLRL